MRVHCDEGVATHIGPEPCADVRARSPRSQKAAGNICTEELVLLCEEMDIDTGIDLDALIEVGRMAEEVVGHQLPGELIHAGSLDAFRAAPRPDTRQRRSTPSADRGEKDAHIVTAGDFAGFFGSEPSAQHRRD